MNKGMIQGIVIGAVVVTAGAALARYQPWDTSDKASFDTSQPLVQTTPSQSESVVDTNAPGTAASLAPGASTAALAPLTAYALVTNVEPAMKTVRTPRQVCKDVQVTDVKQPKDEHKIAGSVIGAVVGGIVGNQVGHGTGKTLATIAGAAGGGYAGNRIQNRVQQGNTVTTTQQQCETVYDTTEKQSGYRVTYQLDGRTKTIQMDRDPGQRIPVRDGQLVIASR